MSFLYNYRFRSPIQFMESVKPLDKSNETLPQRKAPLFSIIVIISSIIITFSIIPV